MSAITLPGCLITEAVQFEPPAGFPSSIASPSNADLPLDDIIRMSATDATIPAIVVEILDPDVDQELAYKVYVDYRAEAPRPADLSDFIPAIARSTDADRTRRRLSFEVPVAGTGLATAGCHRIELLVSSGFRPDRREPLREGDLASAVWWVATIPAGGGPVEMVSCP